MKSRYSFLLFILILASSAFAQVSVEKVEPPSWWTGSTVSPVRVLLRGKELNVGTVWTNSTSLKASNLKASANGHYLFFDLAIAPTTKAGKYKISVGNKQKFAAFDFEILPKGPTAGRYQGFTPDDVIYLIMPDRFADGDTSNNDEICGLAGIEVARLKSQK